MKMSVESKEEEGEEAPVGQVFEVTNVKEAYEWERRMHEWHESSQEYSHQIKEFVEQMATAEAQLRKRQDSSPCNPLSELPSRGKEDKFAPKQDVEMLLRDRIEGLSTMTKQMVMDVAQGRIIPIHYLRNKVLECVTCSQELHNMFAMCETQRIGGESFLKGLIECNSLAMGFTRLLYDHKDRGVLMKTLMQQLERLQNLVNVVEASLRTESISSSEVVNTAVNTASDIQSRQAMSPEVGNTRCRCFVPLYLSCS